MLPVISLNKTETEIIKRMIYYKGADSMPIFSGNKTFNEIKSTFRKIFNTDLNSNNGWLRAEMIEYPNSPYSDKSRYKNKRWDYLEDSLGRQLLITEIDYLIYIDARGRKSDKGYKMYRIRKDRGTLKKLFFLFYYDNQNKNMIHYFLNSDYFKESGVTEEISRIIRFGITNQKSNDILNKYVLPPSIIHAYLTRGPKIFNLDITQTPLTIKDVITSYLLIAYIETENLQLKQLYKKQLINIDNNIDKEALERTKKR